MEIYIHIARKENYTCYKFINKMTNITMHALRSSYQWNFLKYKRALIAFQIANVLPVATILQGHM